MIEAFRSQRPRIAANRDLATLRGMFNWAVLQRLVPGHAVQSRDGYLP
jgi:hypothetical protein